MLAKQKFKTSKWIMMSIAILLNGFIIFYSCLDSATTDKWTSYVTKIVSTLVNRVTEKEVKTIPLTELTTSLSDKTSYQYNDIPGYGFNEIPLGSAKQIECSFAPNDATDKSVNYYTEQTDMVTLNQSGSTVSVVGMKPGNVTIYAKNNTSNLVSSVDVVVVDVAEPKLFDVSLPTQEVSIGGVLTLEFDIDGGVLGHNELINSRYYDIRKLSYSSCDENILTIDNNGVIHPKNVGNTSITVSNHGGVFHSFDKQVNPGTEITPYSDLNISGSNVCYANDMLLDQNSKKNHFQLEIKDGETVLDPKDFIWESSNDLLVRVDRYGVMRGFRKTTNNDECATIKAISKLTGQEVNFEVTVKNQLPTQMYYWLEIGDKSIWNPKEYTVCVGDNIKVNIGYSPSTSTKAVEIETSNPDIIDFTNQGSYFVVHVKQEGLCTINFTSIVNPELKAEIKFTVLKAGAIATEDIKEVEHNLRKSLGHAAVFSVAQIFTFITFYMFLYDKQLWLYSSLSLGSGLLLASISELIQYFVPTRTGAFLDIMIDFSGVLVGAILVLVTLLIIYLVQKKTSK